MRPVCGSYSALVAQKLLLRRGAIVVWIDAKGRKWVEEMVA